MNRFQPHEYVRVINIDDEPLKWQYLPSHSEQHTFTPDPMKITTRGDVEVYLLNPGESEVLLGECAYIMIEDLYKKLSAKKALSGVDILDKERTAVNFNFTDAGKQEEIIDRIYLGKEAPMFSGYKDGENEAEAGKDIFDGARKPKAKTERILRSQLAKEVATA